jgi:hypothetical protein
VVTPAAKTTGTAAAQGQAVQSPEKTSTTEVLLGVCTLGPMGTGSRSALHWRQMMKRPGVPNCMWHRIRGQQRKPFSSTGVLGGSRPHRTSSSLSPERFSIASSARIY